MAIKLSNLAKIFSGESSETQKNKTTSSFNWRTLFSRSSKKSSSDDKPSLIKAFFNKFLLSKTKARGATNTAFDNASAVKPADIHVRRSTTGEMPSVEEIVLNTPRPNYYQEDIAQNTTPRQNEHSDPSGTTVTSHDEYAELDRRRALIESDAGIFDFDIQNIPTLLQQPLGNLRSPQDLEPTEILSDAFQIYFEEGKKVHKEKSFSVPGWEFQEIPNTSQHLGDLLTKLEKIQGTNDTAQQLIEKAKVALQKRIASLQSS
jgi:hypothetical protein